MWDFVPDGLYLMPEKQTIELREKYSSHKMEELLKLVYAYEEWIQSGNVYDFNAIFRGSRHISYKENMEEFKVNMIHYDAICREIARRSAQKK